MKALILSAGLGTRLLPHTEYIPKALFRISGKPVLQIMIEKLIDSGCDTIYINTHHLHDRIEYFIQNSCFPVPVTTVYEPIILDTGGAIANLKAELSSDPFFVVNSDIITDMDFNKLRQVHAQGNQLATLALHDCPEFNKIDVDPEGCIRSFTSESGRYAFTGIQVLSPEIFSHMPATRVFSSIDLYSALLGSGSVRACIFDSLHWTDIGTPQSFSRACLEHLSRSVIPCAVDDRTEIQPIDGDGSDRLWYRFKNQNLSYVVSYHGILSDPRLDSGEYRAFIEISTHLHQKKLPVPRIIAQDPFCGLVALEDLGDTQLEKQIRTLKDENDRWPWYQKVCDVLYRFSQTGIHQFNSEWTYQTREYDKPMIIEKECRYFFNEFVVKYLKRDLSYDAFAPEFDFIAGKALENGFSGLMHRDFQSRNIMIKDQQIYLIDFQSARKGPVQYDLASLLIDPYTGLSDAFQRQVFNYFYDTYIRNRMDRVRFKESFLFCRITRNLQILGAFSFLTSVKHKTFFERYIPAAVCSLKKHLNSVDIRNIPKLHELVQAMKEPKSE